MIRPELRALLRDRSELLIFGGLTLLGLWLTFLGGWFFALVGAGVVLVGASLTVGALRHAPFRRPVAAPGVVELVEGAVRYYGATEPGGEVALRDLTEIRLLRLRGRACWRLRSQDGQALLIPVDAAGAAVLADAFETLPGLDLGMLSKALSHVAAQPEAMRTVWRRPS
ncbi:hypothetical protein [Paracoccus beibuensis]|uniref:hypothetical protein n=1 Tax=Paracoccus beibuensis TaxID=547602 RepID=UPI00224017E9|nr:hypothetical protein [Paracoccus beibuensis]